MLFFVCACNMYIYLNRNGYVFFFSCTTQIGHSQMHYFYQECTVQSQGDKSSVMAGDKKTNKPPLHHGILQLLMLLVFLGKYIYIYVI